MLRFKRLSMPIKVTMLYNRDFMPFLLNFREAMVTCDCPVTAASAGQTLASLCGGGQFMLFMGLLEVFIRSQCDLEDPCNRPKERFSRDIDYDYDFIVIGGGSGGSVTVRKSE